MYSDFWELILVSRNQNTFPLFVRNISRQVSLHPILVRFLPILLNFFLWVLSTLPMKKLSAYFWFVVGPLKNLQTTSIICLQYRKLVSFMIILQIVGVWRQWSCYENKFFVQNSLCFKIFSQIGFRFERRTT